MVVKYNNKEYEIECGDKVSNVLEKLDNNEYNVVACKVNNEIKLLDKVVTSEDKKIELIDMRDRDGMRIYIRGLLFIMGKAFKELYENPYLTVNYQLNHAMYCELDNMEVTDELLNNVKAKMQEIVAKNIPIKKVELSKEEAEKFYEKEGSQRGKLQLDNKLKSGVSLYFCEDYYNYFYGVMPITTGVLKYFDILKYNDGFLIRYPSKRAVTVVPEFEDKKKLANVFKEYQDIHKILDVHTIEKLNNMIRNGKAKDIILLDEALHEKKIANIADEIVKRENVKVVLIAGPSSSGKTTFSKRMGIQLRLNGFKVVTISVDNYFVERENTPLDENGEYDFEAIEAIDLDLFNKHLTDLLDGKEIDVPTFNFKLGKKEYNGEKMKLAEDEILVIEGIHCLNDRLTSAIPKEQKYKIYISALTVLNMDYYNRISTTDTRLIRRIVRDNQFRGYSARQTIEKWPSVNAGEEKNIFPFQEEADSMFNSSLIYELAVLKDYALPLLEEISSDNPEYVEAKRLVQFLKYFESVDSDYIPQNSLLKEFTGGSVFEL